MGNPLFERFFDRGGQSVHPGMQSPSEGQIRPNMSMQEAMAQLRSDPAGMVRRAGYNVPDELLNNPQATVMHLIQSGQVGGPAMQRIQPLMQMLTGRR